MGISAEFGFSSREVWDKNLTQSVHATALPSRSLLLAMGMLGATSVANV